MLKSNNIGGTKMKKPISVILVLMLLVSIMVGGVSAADTASPTTSSVLVNGQAISFEAYNINGSNFFKLRDLAKALNGTEKQFEVGWDANNNAISLTSGKAYTVVGGELVSSDKKGNQSAAQSSSSIYLNGNKVNLTAYNINDNNYFKLRDVGNIIGFNVDWDGSKNTIIIDTTALLSVHFLDVGQGDSTFIVLPDGKTMLIDAGESEYADSIVNYIKNQGFNSIDYLVATHPHSDHIGGMAKVIDNFNIKSIYMPKASTTTKTFENLLVTIKNSGLKVDTAKAGVNIFNSNDLTISMVAPNNDSYDDLNNYSAVVKLTYKNNTFLFMGDAEELSENEITANVKADVLKVGHHGSSTSTSQNFLNKVSPKYAVISAGKNNSYGHPTETTLNKLKSAGVTTYITYKDGTTIFKSNGTNINVSFSNSPTPSPIPTANPSPTPTPTIKPTPSPEPSNNPIGLTVYITKTGTKYHNAGCKYLSDSSIAISLPDAKTKGYTPCSVCKPAA